MQQNSSTTNPKKLDSYSMLICVKYFESKDDFINIMCVNSKFKETTEKLRYNPISIKSLKLFPNIQTQYLYSKRDLRIKRNQVVKYEMWYEISYAEYLNYTKGNIKCHYVKYTRENRLKYGEVIPSGVNILFKKCFSGSGPFTNDASKIKELIVPSTLKSLGSYCFRNCELLSLINLPPTLTYLGDDCFFRCTSLQSINLPYSLTSLSSGCFHLCKSLTSITLPTTIVELGDRCFCDCKSLTHINLPPKITTLLEFCFSDCISLQSINLPSMLNSLGKSCFSSCTSLQLIDLPSTLTSFGTGCFYDCNQLKGKISVSDEYFKYIL